MTSKRSSSCRRRISAFAFDTGGRSSISYLLFERRAAADDFAKFEFCAFDLKCLGLLLGYFPVARRVSSHSPITPFRARVGGIDAMKARHSYGATDNIILDYRMKAGGKEYPQGDITDVGSPFELTVKIMGTQPVRQVDVIRNNQFLMTKNPLQREVEFSFRDNSALKGEHYYYIRAIQVDDQMAWSSPIRVRTK